MAGWKVTTPAGRPSNCIKKTENCKATDREEGSGEESLGVCHPGGGLYWQLGFTADGALKMWCTGPAFPWPPSLCSQALSLSQSPTPPAPDRRDHPREASENAPSWHYPPSPHPPKQPPDPRSITALRRPLMPTPAISLRFQERRHLRRCRSWTRNHACVMFT